MENKINIVELLKDCPQGMELYSPIYGFGNLTKITDRIHVKFPKEHNVKCFRLDGKVSVDGECMLFPKGKTTWEGFQRPFKDGDILATDLGSVFYLNTRLNTNECYGCYVGKGGDGSFHICEPFAYKECCGLATEEEKQKLFDAIKANGYKWNAETKTLEKLIEPKFKVGDRIKLNNSRLIFTITDLLKDRYRTTVYSHDLYEIEFERQDAYTLVPDKFDITTLKPFDKVLVRPSTLDKWHIQFFERYDKNVSKRLPFICLCGTTYGECIPYNGNEYLLNTTDNCDEYYKTWK